MLKVPTPQSVRRDVSLEISNVSQSDRRQRPCSSASSRLSFRQPELNMEHFQPVVFCCLKRENKPRIWFIKLMSWPWFERASILVILVNCVTLGMYDPFDMNCVTDQCQVLERLETAIYVFFLLEMLIKWVAMGLFGQQGYFKDPWNKLDCFIVAAGSFELAYGEGEYLSAVRSIRVLRPLRAINRVPSIRILVTLLLDTLPMLGNVLAICFFIFAIFGIIGVQLWQGLLRSRCFPDQLNDTIINKYNLSTFYRPSFDKPDYVCSLPGNNGLSKCDESHFNHHDYGGDNCNQSFPFTMNESSCWNKYYTTCKDSGENIFWGSISFDNIGIATVAIFQIITLEGWTDIMYKIQDAHSFWNWLYFVVLILLGSYFMTNLCLVVITSQFQETKQRETDLLRISRLRSRASVSTVSSSLVQHGCYTQILHYIEHLCRRLKRRVKSWLKLEKPSKRRRVRPCIPIKNRKDNVKSIHHHHHHYHYYHHYVHHRPCQCSSEIFDSAQASSEPAVSTEMSSSISPPSDHVLGITQDTQDSKNGKEGKRILVVPQIQVFAQAATALYNDSDANSSGEIVSTATANINVQGHDSSASVVTYSKSADAVALATQATTQTIEAACSCAAQQSGEDNVRVITRAYGDSVDSSEDEKEQNRTKKDKSFYVKFRDNMTVFVESTRFTRVILASIFLNTICMAVEHHGQPEEMTDVLEICNILFTMIFAFEMLAKIIAFGPYGYIKDPYNLFDGVIVIVSLMDILAGSDTTGISVLRSFRLLRIFKLVRFMPALQRQLSVMIKTLDNVMTFLALLLLFIFTSSILGMHLFGGKYQFPDEDGQLVTSRANFDTLFWALVTVFQVLTQEDWNVVLYDGMKSLSPWSALYFMFLMIIGNYILFNLLVAILVEGFADHTENEKLSLKGEKDTDPVFLSTKHAQRGGDDTEKEPALSWPNINSMLNDETLDSKQLSRCKSAPGKQELTQKPQRSTSYLHILTVDNLTSELSAEESGNKYERTLCHSPEDEFHDTSRVPLHSKRTSQDSSAESNERSSCFKRRASWSLYLFSPENRFRQLMVKIHSHPWFDRVVLFFILFNCIIMALEEPGLDRNSKKGQFIDIMNYIFTAIFTVEMSIKVISLGLIIGPGTYLRSGWNIVDGILVLFSLVDLVVSLTTDSQSGILGVLRVFRAFRTLRPLRVINRAPELKLVVETLLSSLKPIGNVVLIAATFFTIFGILGVQLFKGKFYSCSEVPNTVEIKNKSQCLLHSGKWSNNEYNFDHLARALLTLFVFATKDGWVTIMYSGVDAVGVDQEPKRDYSKWNVLYFVAFLLLAGFVVLNMLVGIVVENFHKCQDELLKEQHDNECEKIEMNERSRNNSLSDIDYEGFPVWRQKIFLLVTHDYFDLAIAVVIGVNVLCMAMEHYDQPENLTLFLTYANYVFTIMFIIEALLKLLALGLKNYFKNRWNCLDMAIVILSIGGIILDELATSNFPMNPTIIRVMRVLRITRVLKLLKTAEGIRSLLDTVGKALPQVANLGMLFLLLFFIFGALGMELFGNITCEKVECEGLDTHAHFRNFGYSVLTLFRVSTGDNWNGILKDTIDSKRCKTGEIEGCEIIQNIAPIYFASFVLITQFVLLNVVVAVMMKHLEESKVQEASTIKNHSPRTARLFPGKKTPETPRTSRNLPRFLKGSQQSLRSQKSESEILKKKRSISVDGARRVKSLDEIRSRKNNLRLSYNSGSDSDCFLDDIGNEKGTSGLRQRKPSLENDNFFEMRKIKNDKITERSNKNLSPVMKILDVADTEAATTLGNTSELTAASSESCAKSSEPKDSGASVRISEPIKVTSDPLAKSSVSLVKSSESNNVSSAFDISLDDGNECRNNTGKKGVAAENEEIHRLKQGSGLNSVKSGNGKEIKKRSEDKMKEGGLQEEDNKNRDKFMDKKKVLKEEDNKMGGLPKKNKEMTDKNEKVNKEKEGLGMKKEKEDRTREDAENEIEKGEKSGQIDYLKETNSSQKDNQNNKEQNMNEKNKQKDCQKKDFNPGANSKQNEGISDVEDSLDKTNNTEQNLTQKGGRPQKQKLSKGEVEQDSRNEFQKDKTSLRCEEGPDVNVVDNIGKKQDSQGDHFGTNEGSHRNLMDNKGQRGTTHKKTEKLDHESGGNLVDNAPDISDAKQQGNTRTHRLKLDPLPDNANKLTPSASNV